ncbi:MAG: preprotein translocase subunit [Candidatus Phytoplasma cynodontis]|uniref:preprotein translocase subunit SecE n=1 Tax='Cynodon dactylon' phytoplasma TaxID=295320 RepID=UPI001265B313|nr:preprotein translocase subunit SecE ['Cynodon dactylon' phytoplasma]KAB8122002.1 preprotein translocase subunit SecE ['Cynodon dactylon' phytoplasma]WIA07581.1 MAG: preprotein translocase subunit [Candidatus Phytoplasma cynodontis]
MVYKDQEEKNYIPILDVLKKEYNLFDIFLVFFSILFMGICQTLKYSYLNSSINNVQKFFSFLFFLFFCFFLYGIYPFFHKMFKEIYLISWPSYKQIFLQIFQVFLFTLILEVVIYFLSYLYDKVDPVFPLL